MVLAPHQKHYSHPLPVSWVRMMSQKGETEVHLPFRYPWGVRDCLVCTKTVSVTTFPTTMAKVRQTMNTTARRWLRKPQQHTEQSGASDRAEPGPASVEALRLNGDSVAGSNIVELLYPLMLESGAAMAAEGLMFWRRQQRCAVFGGIAYESASRKRNRCCWTEGWTTLNKQFE